MEDAGEDGVDASMGVLAPLPVGQHTAVSLPAIHLPLRQRRGRPMQTENVSRKTLLQQKRRLQVYDSRALALEQKRDEREQDKQQNLYDAVDGVLVPKSRSSSSGGSGQHITFNTAYRLALSPAHVGNQTLSQLMFASKVSQSAVRRSNLRFAAALRTLHQSVLHGIVDGTRADLSKKVIHLTHL